MCVYYEGDYLGKLGTPHRIFISNFVLVAGADGFIKFLISNPDG